MKNHLKKMALACQTLTLAFVIGLLVQPPLGFTAYNDDTSTGYNNIRVGNLKLTDSGVYDSNGSLRYTPGSANLFTGNMSSTGGQESMGTVGVALSTNNTSGFSAGQLYYAYLGGSTNALEGSVLIATTTVAGQGVTVQVAPVTAGLTNIAGIASSAVSTGSIVGVFSSGSWAMALTTGTVLAGDQLATSAVSGGYLYAPTSGTSTLLPSTATIAVALTNGGAGARARVRLK